MNLLIHHYAHCGLQGLAFDSWALSLAIATYLLSRFIECKHCAVITIYLVAFLRSSRAVIAIQVVSIKHDYR